jgi:hypothetical protein
MATIPENFLDLLKAKNAFANITTVMKDGSPQSHADFVRLHRRQNPG